MAADEATSQARPSNTDTTHPSTTTPEKSKPAPVTKSKPAPPALSAADDDTLELKDMLPSEPPLPPAGDIMRLAQVGDEIAIRRLLDSGIVKATYADAEGITPLHWAAINNRYAVCKILIEAGADVNALGGKSVATPAMWAAQEKHYYIVHLLLQNGADTKLTDGQGYNILHLATFNGNLFLIILLLHQGIKVDIQDAEGHTPLMWAAYKGFPQCVDLYLRWGADVTAVDTKQLTPLHWALVKGNYLCIQKLIEYGSDRFAKTDAGKTPLQAAEEMDTLDIYIDALAECNYTPEGRPKHANAPFFLSIPESRAKFMERFFFIYPFALEWIMFWMLANCPFFLSVALLGGIFVGSQWITNEALDYAHPDQKALHKTPYLAGIFAGTCFWVALRYIFVILPSTFGGHMLLNLFFAVTFSLVIYFYTCCMISDPGYVPKLESQEDQKEVVHDLITSWRFDDKHFCMQCMIRMPLRSKHCKRCNRCVGKHDHHCPWIFNCVGVNNHQQFFLYIINLELGIFALLALTYYHLISLPEPSPPSCTLLSDAFCRPILTDPWTAVVVLWAGLQTTWVSMLLIVQSIQVFRGQTTYENMHHVNHGYDDNKISNTVASVIAGGSTSLDGLQLNQAGHGPDPVVDGHGHSHGGHRHGGGGAHSHAHAHKHQGCFTRIARLLGVDAFMATARGDKSSGAASARRRNQNPFSRGAVGNCKDFWCIDDGNVFKRQRHGEAAFAGQTVNYYNMYEVPRPTMRRREGGGGQGGQYQSVEQGDGDAV